MALSLLNLTTVDRILRKQASDLITDPARIAALLQNLFEQRINLGFRLAGSQYIFNSTVFAVDKRNLAFNIDGFMPICGHTMVLQQQSSLFAMSQGQGPLIAFTTQLAHTGNSSDSTYYKLQFPKSIKYTERRNLLRAELTATERLDLNCTQAYKLLSGYVKDISATGMSVILDNADLVNSKDGLHCCRLDIPEEESMLVDLEIRHLKKLGTGQVHIGGLFKNLKAVQKKTIGNFIRRVERNNLSRRC